MESPLCIAKMNPEQQLDQTQQKLTNTKHRAQKCQESPSMTNLNCLDKMSGSINSSGTLDDSTPSDSGVQTMDSDTSELMIDSITSQTGLEFEDSSKLKKEFIKENSPSTLKINARREFTLYDNNSNITTTSTTATAATRSTAIEDTMTASQCSTFDTTENIVYRRKVRKTTAAAKAPKKRVSFHEDILKNTRTDNIHIEHGFITYKAGVRKFSQNPGTVAGRYSWCSEGDKVKIEPSADLADDNDDEGNTISDSLCGNDGKNKSRRYVVYRNACSDVLDYGNSDIYDINQGQCLQYDNSGVFEYMPKENLELNQRNGDNTVKNKNGSPECSCSNSSSDSDETDKNSNCQQYPQAKSNSCDCIRSTHDNNNIGDNCYYSEPNIGSSDNSPHPKSVWNKEKKPKTSCLKKNIMGHTNIIIPEQDLSTKMKKFNVHDMNQLLDNGSKMIFGSLRSIFTIPLPERGVPEGSEDIQSVMECVPEVDGHNVILPEAASRQSQADQVIQPSESPPIKAKPFLSKSLDGSKQQQMAKQFVHNVDEQLRRRNETECYTLAKNDNGVDSGLSFLDDSKKATEGQNKQSMIKQFCRQHEFDLDSDAITVGDVTVTSSVINCNAAPPFRNKFIINCESTVFEHTGVSYTYENSSSFNDLTHMEDARGSIANIAETITPLAQPLAEAKQLRNNFITAPLAKTFSNFFRSIKEVGKSSSIHKPNKQIEQEIQEKTKEWQAATDNYFALKMSEDDKLLSKQLIMPKSSSPMEVSTISEISTITNTTTTTSIDNDKCDNVLSSNSKPGAAHKSYTSLTSGIGSSALSLSSQKDSLAIGIDSREKLSRHLPSPLRKRSSINGNDAIVMQQYYAPRRYGGATMKSSQTDYLNLNQEIFNVYGENGCVGNDGSGRDSKSTLLSEEFDDILTITTDTDKNDNSDIIILDYPESQTSMAANYSHQVKISSNHHHHVAPPATKTSLINRFLRNVTQKKILESSIKQNQFFAQKLKTEKKLFNGELYVKGVKPRKLELIDDLNAEIAMEIETCAHKSPQRKLITATTPTLTAVPTTTLDVEVSEDLERFELGIGEISIDVFLGATLNFLLDRHEQLMKAFKLYTGYSKEGFMTPVLVFLTDKTLYVTDLVRNRLCSKFILLYKDLDVILMGPYGNTVLLSNSTRNMQQVLLTGGSNAATSLVVNLELCARRNGSVLPAVGQLTIDHLAPLKKFVHENSCIDKNDNWLFYAVVNMPGFSLGATGEQEPLGPHAKGFLMHRHIKDHMNSAKLQPWNPGYFLLKAGVLYMFNDSTQKIPSWAMALAECQGARRSVKAQRPHCFEIMLKDRKLLQLAAPDEYVASDWLQALLQTASGLFEMQEKHKILGCTVIVTDNHLITLREDFSTPLKQINKKSKCEKATPMTTTGKSALPNNYATFAAKPNSNNNFPNKSDDDLSQFIPTDNSSLISSAFSTPTCGTLRSCSSINSTPTKLSQLSHSTATNNTNNTSRSTTTATTTTTTTTNNCRNMLESSLNSSATNHSITSTPTHSKLLQTEDEEREHPNSVNSQSSIMKSVYGKNSGIEILTSANIKDMIGIKIPSPNETWWCILEFSYQEVRECSDDLVIFFANSNEMQRFLKILEQIWQTKHNDLFFPITVFDDDDPMAEQCTTLYMDINRSWEPLLSAALGYPL